MFAKDVKIEMNNITIIMDYPIKLLLDNVDNGKPQEVYMLISHHDKNYGQSTIASLGLIKIIKKNLFMLRNQRVEFSAQQSDPE